MPPSGKEVVKALRKAGFEIDRIKGSHHFMRHEDGRVSPVPVHANRDLSTGLYRRILSDVGLSDAELKELI